MNAPRAWASACVVVGLLAGAASALNMEAVPVGDPGNAPDTRYSTTGVGSVSYTYNIGKYEVTAGQYCEFLNAVAKTDTHALYSTVMSRTDSGCGITRSGGAGSYTYSVDPAFVNRPVNNVSWGDAARFANWLHNGQPTGVQGLSTTEDGAYYLIGAVTNDQLLAVSRKSNWKWALPSEDEWYKAAYYKGGSANAGYWNYPTRSNSVPGRDLSDVSGNNANYYNGTGSYPIDAPYYTTVAGEFQNSVSPYGTFDQGGNMWEWDEAVINGYYRGLRGGSLYNYDYYLHASNYYADYPLVKGYGFRVVQVPEPCSAALLLLGCLPLGKRCSRIA
jgi:sulfatase modifying factor 1